MAAGQCRTRRQRDFGVPKAPEHGAQQVVRSPQAAHLRKIGAGVDHAVGVDAHALALELDVCAHTGKDVREQMNVLNIRQVFDHARTVRHQRGRKNGHRGVLAPLMLTVPERGRPPRITSFSKSYPPAKRLWRRAAKGSKACKKARNAQP